MLPFYEHIMLRQEDQCHLYEYCGDVANLSCLLLTFVVRQE